MALETPFGLWALTALIPFIILYLRRPKPKEQQIPSLMFLVKEQKKSKQFSFFKRFTSNWLFFIQLLILSLLAYALASPTINIPYDVTKENTVIILDASASMNTKEGSDTRFEQAVDKAKGYLSGRNTIILAESSPLIVLEDESTEVARDVLGRLDAKATSTNLGDALLLAKDILSERSGTIFVISDFLVTEGPDVQIVKTTVENEERAVSFIPVGSEVENIGIIDLQVRKFSSSVRIKNFASESKEVTITIESNGETVATSDPLTIAPYSIEPFEFETPAGQSKVMVTPEDQFMIDNEAYISTPDKTSYNVLLITSEQSTNVELALTATPLFDVTVVNPPVLTISTTGDRIEPYSFDAIILYRTASENILPGTFDDITDYVKRGGTFIYAAQPDMSGLRLGELELVTLKDSVETPSSVCTDTTVSVTKQFTNQPCFTTVSRYFTGETTKGTLSLASAGGSPQLALKELGGGWVAYYGILDEYSDFSTLPAFPIYWHDLLVHTIGIEDVLTYNYQTGAIVSFDQQEVQTPTQTLTTSKLLLDEQGIYSFGGRTLAVNLLHEKESLVSTNAQEDIAQARNTLLETEASNHDFSLVFALSSLIFLLVLLELLMIKRRGDL